MSFRNVLCILTIWSVGGCEFQRAASYISELKKLETCISSGVELMPDLGTLSGVLAGSVDLSTCQDLASCQSVIRSFAGKQKNGTLLNVLAVKMSSDPSGSCSCLESSAPNLDDCSSLVTSINENYCQRFFPSPTSSPSIPPTWTPTLMRAEESGNNPLSPGTDKCSLSIATTCKIQKMPPSFNETISCLRSNFASLEKDCSLMLDVFLAGIFRGCGSDIVSKCETSFSTNSPARTMACLAWNYKDLSESCRGELADLAGEAIPCEKEATEYCQGSYLPEQVFDCLSNSNHIEDYSTLCKDMVVGFQQCSGGESGDGGGGGGGGGKGGGGIRKSKPGPPEAGGDAKSKPAPPESGGDGPPFSLLRTELSIKDKLRLRRMLQNEGTSNSKPKPRPGQSGPNEKRPGQDGGGIRPKPKPNPNNPNPNPNPKQQDGSGESSNTEEKPKPAKQKPCWERNGEIFKGKGNGKGQNGKGGEGGNKSGPGGEYEGASSGHDEKASKNNPTDDEAPEQGPPHGGPLPLVLVVSLVVAVLIVYRFREKMCSFLGARSDLSAPPAGYPATSAVEMSSYVRADTAENEDYGESSSHPLATGKSSSSI